MSGAWTSCIGLMTGVHKWQFARIAPNSGVGTAQRASDGPFLLPRAATRLQDVLGGRHVKISGSRVGGLGKKLRTIRRNRSILFTPMKTPVSSSLQGPTDRQMYHHVARSPGYPWMCLLQIVKPYMRYSIPARVGPVFCSSQVEERKQTTITGAVHSETSLERYLCEALEEY